MIARKLTGFSLLAGLLLCLLAVPAVLARSSPPSVAGRSLSEAGAQQASISPRMSLQARSALIPGNPSTAPAPNTHTAPPTSTISLVYDEPISPATVSAHTFAVHAMQTGLLTQTYTVSGGSISLTPQHPFHAGELVQVSATSGTLNLSGQGPVSPTVWTFQAAVTGGYAHFVDSGQTLPFSDTYAVALGDLDGDGDLDALFANEINQANEVWLNDGMGFLTRTHQSLGTIGSLGVALGDLDHDGDLDAFIPSMDGTDADEIWFNDGQASFTRSNQSLNASSGGRVALGDLDGDGDLDALFGHFAPGSANPGQVWLNDGGGVFTATGQLLGDADTYELALGDLDGDGDLDAFAANGYFGESQPNQVWLNDGHAAFVDSYPSLGSGRSTAVALRDLDGDGDLDAFVANYEDQPNEVWLNDGSGLFTDSGQRLGDASSWDVALGDVDGDGDLDAFVANANVYGDYVEPSRVWLNDGTGVFTATAQSLGEAASLSVALGDLDGDGDLDALAANSDLDLYYTSQGHPNQVWLNTQPQIFLPLVMGSGGPDFSVTSVRQLTPCENEGRHHIFTHVVDTDGVGVSDIPIKICWGAGPNDCALMVTDEAGWAVFAMFKGVYSVQVATGASQVASGLTGDYAPDEACEATDNPVANSRFHVSFEVIFRKNR
jgi:hypothetical protein